MKKIYHTPIAIPIAIEEDEPILQGSANMDGPGDSGGDPGSNPDLEGGMDDEEKETSSKLFNSYTL